MPSLNIIASKIIFLSSVLAPVWGWCDVTQPDPENKNTKMSVTNVSAGIPAEIANYFSGTWSGKGEFASGKKIEAEVSFTPDLNNQWLLYRHTDKLPNQYKSLGMWGVERNSKKLVMVVSDSFNSARLFVSEGWQQDKLEFNNSMPITPMAISNARKERFIFEKISLDSFKMTYESNTNDSGWKLGDFLIFNKLAN